MQSFVTLLDSSEEHHVETQSTPFVILLSSLTTNIVMRWDSTKFFVHTSNKSVPTGIQKIQDIFFPATGGMDLLFKSLRFHGV